MFFWLKVFFGENMFLVKSLNGLVLTCLSQWALVKDSNCDNSKTQNCDKSQKLKMGVYIKIIRSRKSLCTITEAHDAVRNGWIL